VSDRENKRSDWHRTISPIASAERDGDGGLHGTEQPQGVLIPRFGRARRKRQTAAGAWHPRAR
jgi:hypothetical protein